MEEVRRPFFDLIERKRRRRKQDGSDTSVFFGTYRVEKAEKKAGREQYVGLFWDLQCGKGGEENRMGTMRRPERVFPA